MIDAKEQTELDVYLKQYESILGIIKFEPDCTQSRRLFEAGIAYQGAYRKIQNDTTPLTREEIEVVLKEAGYVYDSQFSSDTTKMFVKESGICTIDNTRLVYGINQFTIPLSAVTRQTLRACGVVK